MMPRQSIHYAMADYAMLIGLMPILRAIRAMIISGRLLLRRCC